MLTSVRHAALEMLTNCGVFRQVADSEWRRNHLLILCYHAISRSDEHLWRPGLYFQPDSFERRLKLLQDGSYNVLPLGEGLSRLEAGELPSRSVAITFDDGGYD